MGDHRLLSRPNRGLPRPPALWQPPAELSLAEHASIKPIRRAKVFVCRRQDRHALFAEACQQA
jgi:hypothetical protein